jgi:hypothetical protein
VLLLFHTLCNSLQHTVLSVRCVFTSPLVSTSNGRCSSSSGFPCLNHSNSQLINSQKLHSHSRLITYMPFKKVVSSQTKPITVDIKTNSHLASLSVSSKTPQPEGPGPHIHIPQEQGGPVLPLGSGSPFCPLLWFKGLQWRYFNPPPKPLYNKSCNL